MEDFEEGYFYDRDGIAPERTPSIWEATVYQLSCLSSDKSSRRLGNTADNSVLDFNQEFEDRYLKALKLRRNIARRGQSKSVSAKKSEPVVLLISRLDGSTVLKISRIMDN